MAVKIKFDSNHNVIPPTFVLATRSGKKMNTPIPAIGITIADHFNDKFELNFSVSKYVNGVEYPLWDKLQDFKLCWCKEWDIWFEMYVEKTDDYSLAKHITLVSLGEAELSQINLYGIEINTEDDIARNDYEPSVLYNPDKPKASILNRILEKAPHYSIEFVDTSIASIQRTFSFDDTTIYDAMQEIAEEIDCIFVFNSNSNSDGSIKRSISVYDLESYCYECENRGHFSGTCPECGSTNVTRGYGEDTSIFVSTENLADEITLTTDYESVKNCFRLEAGDDLMTATIINCNPNGSQYIWYITDKMKEDMSDRLVAKLEEYDAAYAYYRDGYPTRVPSNLVTSYNNIVTKYRQYQEDLATISSPITGYSTLMNVYYDTINLQLLLESTLMPTRTVGQTDAATQAALLTAGNISPVSVNNLSSVSLTSANNAVLSAAKTLIDPRFKVKIVTSSYNSSTHIWTGNFTVENYSDEEDVATSTTINVTLDANYERFLKQQIDKTLKNVESEVASQGASDIISLFNLSLSNFTSELKKYCLSSLDLFEDSCQKCLEVLQAQGVADNKTWADKNPNMYSTVYVPYYNKLLAIQAELQVREAEIAVVSGILDGDEDVVTAGVQTYIVNSKNYIQKHINMQNYLGEELWLEFIAYRREDTYSNDNYISDGLNNAELFANALDFLKTANGEIYKSATLQHSLSASLQNLLVIKEFEPIVNYFSVGNWIRVKIDGEVFRLRLISYEIDFDNLSGITIEFSDVNKFVDGMSDSESIMNQAQSMASSYGSVSRQANQGKKSNAVLNNWVQKGLDLTKMKIVDDVDNQNITWDEHGFLCKEFVPFTDTYDDRQLKIISNGLYITDNNWLSIKTAVGRFYYVDPKTSNITEAYGVNGETIVGKLLLGEQLGIYNSAGSLTFDTDGLVVSNNTNIVSINPNSSSIFTIQKKSTSTNIASIDSSGDLSITGVITAKSGKLGNWTLSAHQIAATANNANTGNVDRTTGLQWPGNGVWAIAVGATDPGSWVTAPFRVNHKGELHATAATITGSITANSGNIGGFTVVNEANTGTTSHGGHCYTRALYAHCSDTTYEYEVGMKGDSGSAGYLAFYVGRIEKGKAWSTNTKVFSVANNGKLTATNADITGAITATTLSAKNTYYIHNSSGTKKVAMTAPDSSFGSSLDIGSGFSAIHLGGTNGVVTDGTIYVGGTGTGVSISDSASSFPTLYSGTLNVTTIYAGTTSDTGHITIWLRNSAKQGFLRMTSDGNFGLYDSKNSKWIIYENKNNNVYSERILFSVGYDGTAQRVPIQSVATAKQRVGCASTSSSAMTVRGEWGGSSFTAKNFTPSSSDIRIKTDINDCKVNAIDFINRIKIREFKKYGVYQPIGVIADELEALDPLLSIGGGYEEDGAMNVKSVDSFYLQGYEIKAIQELADKVKELEIKIKQLTA